MIEMNVKSEPIWAFLLGMGIGISIEALALLSPLFETILWKSFCTFVKIIPLIALYLMALIGISLMGIGMLIRLLK